MSVVSDGAGQEETTNDIAIINGKRSRKYLKMLHGQCCSDNCGCCPRLTPPPVPGPHDQLVDINNFIQANEFTCMPCVTE